MKTNNVLWLSFLMFLACVANNEASRFITNICSKTCKRTGNITVLDSSEGLLTKAQRSKVHSGIGCFNRLSHFRNFVSGHSSFQEALSIPYFDGSFAGIETLHTLTLPDSNVITLLPQLPERLPSLKRLDLYENFIFTPDNHDFPSSFVGFRRISPHLQLQLAENPLACSCELIPIYRQNAQHKINISSQMESSTKSYGKRVLDVCLDDVVRDCLPSPWRTEAIAAASFVTIVIIGALIYQFRWPLRLRLYYVIRRFSEEDDSELYAMYADGYSEKVSDHSDAYIYDLVVSCFPDDEGGMWVRERFNTDHRQTRTNKTPCHR
jgi:hypothetical protein